jgi:hypothetical protein
VSIVTYGQGYLGNQAIGTPSGGGTFPAPGTQFANSGYIDDSDDSPAGDRATYGKGGVPTGPGPGPGWNGILQGLAFAGGQALINRLFDGSDSRSTKGSRVPPTPTSGGAIPSPGFTDPFSRPATSVPEPEPLPEGGGGLPFSPLILAAAAAVVLLLFVRR